MGRLTFSAAERADLEVDLWGVVYRRVTLTRPRRRAFIQGQARLDQLGAKIAKQQGELDPLADDFIEQATDLEVGAEREVVLLTGALLDLVLEPIDAGDTRKPSDLVVEKYDADEITLDEIEAFVHRVAEATQGPPT